MSVWDPIKPKTDATGAAPSGGTTRSVWDPIVAPPAPAPKPKKEGILAKIGKFLTPDTGIPAYEPPAVPSPTQDLLELSEANSPQLLYPKPEIPTMTVAPPPPAPLADEELEKLLKQKGLASLQTYRTLGTPDDVIQKSARSGFKWPVLPNKQLAEKDAEAILDRTDPQRIAKADAEVAPKLKELGLPDPATIRSLNIQTLDPKTAAAHPTWAKFLLGTQGKVTQWEQTTTAGKFEARVGGRGAAVSLGQAQEELPTTGNKVLDTAADLVGTVMGYMVPGAVGQKAIQLGQVAGYGLAPAISRLLPEKIVMPAVHAISAGAGGAAYGAGSAAVQGAGLKETVKAAGQEAVLWALSDAIVGNTLRWLGPKVNRVALKAQGYQEVGGPYGENTGIWQREIKQPKLTPAQESVEAIRRASGRATVNPKYEFVAEPLTQANAGARLMYFARFENTAPREFIAAVMPPGETAVVPMAAGMQKAVPEWLSLQGISPELQPIIRQAQANVWGAMRGPTPPRLTPEALALQSQFRGPPTVAGEVSRAKIATMLTQPALPATAGEVGAAPSVLTGQTVKDLAAPAVPTVEILAKIDEALAAASKAVMPKVSNPRISESKAEDGAVDRYLTFDVTATGVEGIATETAYGRIEGKKLVLEETGTSVPFNEKNLQGSAQALVRKARVEQVGALKAYKEIVAKAPAEEAAPVTAPATVEAAKPVTPAPAPVEKVAAPAKVPAIAQGQTVYRDDTGEALTVTDTRDRSLLTVKNADGAEFKIGRAAVTLEAPAAKPEPKAEVVPEAQEAKAQPLPQTQTPLPQVTPTRVEPWQMTFAEFSKQPHHPRDVRFEGNQFHHDIVKEKLQQGTTIPAEVLAEYPDLAPPVTSGKVAPAQTTQKFAKGDEVEVRIQDKWQRGQVREVDAKPDPGSGVAYDYRILTGDTNIFVNADRVRPVSGAPAGRFVGAGKVALGESTVEAMQAPTDYDEAQRRIDTYEDVLIGKYGEDAVIKAPVYGETGEPSPISAAELKRLGRLYAERDRVWTEEEARDLAAIAIPAGPVPAVAMREGLRKVQKEFHYGVGTHKANQAGIEEATKTLFEYVTQRLAEQDEFPEVLIGDLDESARVARDWPHTPYGMNPGPVVDQVIAAIKAALRVPAPDLAAQVSAPQTAAQTVQTAKEPWEMSADEFTRWYNRPEGQQRVRGYGPNINKDKPGNWPAKTIEHNRHFIIEQALSEGKPVPQEVLADYPDLAAKAEAKAPETAAPEVQPKEEAPAKAEKAKKVEAAKAEAATESTSAPSEYSPAIIQAFEDWNGQLAYLDNGGNYRRRPERAYPTYHPSGPIASWNKEVKRAFPDVQEFHKAAAAYMAVRPEAEAAKGLTAPTEPKSSESIEGFIEQLAAAEGTWGDAEHIGMLQTLGVESTGVRLGDAEDAGRRRMLLESGDIDQVEWRKYLEGLKTENRIGDQGRYEKALAAAKPKATHPLEKWANLKGMKVSEVAGQFEGKFRAKEPVVVDLADEPAYQAAKKATAEFGQTQTHISEVERQRQSKVRDATLKNLRHRAGELDKEVREHNKEIAEKVYGRLSKDERLSEAQRDLFTALLSEEAGNVYLRFNRKVEAELAAIAQRAGVPEELSQTIAGRAVSEYTPHEVKMSYSHPAKVEIMDPESMVARYFKDQGPTILADVVTAALRNTVGQSAMSEASGLFHEILETTRITKDETVQEMVNRTGSVTLQPKVEETQKAEAALRESAYKAKEKSDSGYGYGPSPEALADGLRKQIERLEKVQTLREAIFGEKPAYDLKAYKKALGDFEGSMKVTREAVYESEQKIILKPYEAPARKSTSPIGSGAIPLRESKTKMYKGTWDGRQFVCNNFMVVPVTDKEIARYEENRGEPLTDYSKGIANVMREKLDESPAGEPSGMDSGQGDLQNETTAVYIKTPKGLLVVQKRFYDFIHNNGWELRWPGIGKATKAGDVEVPGGPFPAYAFDGKGKLQSVVMPMSPARGKEILFPGDKAQAEIPELQAVPRLEDFAAGAKKAPAPVAPVTHPLSKDVRDYLSLLDQAKDRPTEVTTADTARVTKLAASLRAAFAKERQGKETWGAFLDRIAGKEQPVSVREQFRKDIVAAEGGSRESLGIVPKQLRTLVPAKEEPFAFAPEIEARYKKSQGKPRITTKERLAELGADISQKTTRTFPTLPETPQFMPLKKELLWLEKQQGVAVDEITTDFRGITLGIHRPDLNDLFGRAVFVNGLEGDFKEGLDLPQGFTQENYPGEKERLDAKVADTPAVGEAVGKRREWRRELDTPYIKIMQEIGLDVGDRFKDKDGNIKTDYMHHQVLEYAKLKGLAASMGVKLRTPARRGWLQTREGYSGDINSNYLEADFEVAVQQRVDMAKAEVIKFVMDPANGYNIRKDVSAEYVKRLEELLVKTEDGDETAIQRLKYGMEKNDIPMVAYENTLKSKLEDLQPGILKKHGLKDWHNVIPEGHDAWQPREGDVFYFAHTIPERFAEELMKDITQELGIKASDVERVLVKGGKRKELVLPVEVIETLNNMMKPADRTSLARNTRTLMRWWKQYQLISPARWLKYNFRNLSSDMDALLRGDPTALRKVKQAAIELYAAYFKKTPITGELRHFFDRGGFKSIQVVQEIGDVNSLGVFRDLMEQKFSMTAIPANLVKGYIRGARLTTEWREALLRYAVYLDLLEQMQKSPTGTPKTWGASRPEMIMALTDIRDRAYTMSNELIGAYDEVSEAVQWLSTYAMPFARYQEVEFKRELQLMRNAVNDPKMQAAAGGAVLKGVRKGGRILLGAGKFLLKASMMWAMLQAYNLWFWPDAEASLDPEVRARPHLILGYNKDGEVKYFDRLGCIGDFLEWFGLDTPQYLVERWLSGKMTAREVALEMAKAPVNKAWSMLGPQYKAMAELPGGIKTYPDVFEPGKIRDVGVYLADQLGMGDEYRRIAGLPHRSWEDTLERMLYSVADSGETAYYEILDEKRAYLKKEGDYSRFGGSTSPRSSALYNLKMAVRYEDQEALDKYLQEYVNLGGTEQGIETSLRDMEPLFGLSSKQEKAFKRDWLDDEGRRRLEEAETFYKESVLGSKTLSAWGRTVRGMKPEEKQ